MGLGNQWSGAGLVWLEAAEYRRNRVGGFRGLTDLSERHGSKCLVRGVGPAVGSNDRWSTTHRGGESHDHQPLRGRAVSILAQFRESAKSDAASGVRDCL